METRLTAIDIREAAAYIGCTELSDELTRGLDEAAALVKEAAVPRATWLCLPKNSPILSDILIGHDIDRLLKDCESVAIFAATLGLDIDKQLARLQVTDLRRALLFDACADAAIENVCDNLCTSLRAQYGTITARFSPGYGDLPHAAQKPISEFLRLDRTIGVTLTESGLMIPQKSVTAIVGILKGEQAP